MVSNITFLPQSNINFSGANKTETKPTLELKQQLTGDIVSFSAKKQEDLQLVKMNPSPKNTSDMIKFYNQQEQVTKIISKIGTDNVKTITDFVADGEPKTEAQINNLLEIVSSKLEPDEKDTLKNVLTKASEKFSKLSDEEKLKFKEECKKLEEITKKVAPENKDKFDCIILGIMLLLGVPASITDVALVGYGLAALLALVGVARSNNPALGLLVGFPIATLLAGTVYS